MIFVVRVSYWVRFRMWLAIKLMRAAGKLLPQGCAFQKHEQPDPPPQTFTQEEIRQLNAEMRDHTLQ